MTRVVFFGSGDILSGFLITGHSTQSCDDLDGKFLCAAVSSAAYFAANTLTEIVGCGCDIDVRDGYMSLRIRRDAEGSQVILKGLRLHLQQLAEQYSNIEINLEV